MGNWGDKPTYGGYFTPVITGSWAHLEREIHNNDAFWEISWTVNRCGDLTRQVER